MKERETELADLTERGRRGFTKRSSTNRKNRTQRSAKGWLDDKGRRLELPVSTTTDGQKYKGVPAVLNAVGFTPIYSNAPSVT